MEEDAEGTPDNSTSESPNKSGEWKESDSGIEWITNSLKKAKEGAEADKTQDKSKVHSAVFNSL